MIYRETAIPTETSTCGVFGVDVIQYAVGEKLGSILRRHSFGVKLTQLILALVEFFVVGLQRNRVIQAINKCYASFLSRINLTELEFLRLETVLLTRVFI